jgi:hypothetical protein
MQLGFTDGDVTNVIARDAEKIKGCRGGFRQRQHQHRGHGQKHHYGSFSREEMHDFFLCSSRQGWGSNSLPLIVLFALSVDKKTGLPSDY